MVQEKDAAKKRQTARQNVLARIRDNIENNTIKIKWQVIEHTPGYNTGGYYDQDIPAKNIVVADDFESEEDAKTWMDRHEPDPGKVLFIRKRRLVRRSYTTWI